MNCVLHHLNKPEEIPVLENNYDVLKDIIPTQYVLSFNLGSIPDRPFEQLFYKKLHNNSEEYLEYFKYYSLFQVNRFFHSKNYKRLIYVSSDIKLRTNEGLLNLTNQLTNIGDDCIKFNYKNESCRQMFIMKTYNLDSNLDYANCNFDQYMSRQKYNSFDVYIDSPFKQTHDIENYI